MKRPRTPDDIDDIDNHISKKIRIDYASTFPQDKFSTELACYELVHRPDGTLTDSRYICGEVLMKDSANGYLRLLWQSISGVPHKYHFELHMDRSLLESAPIQPGDKLNISLNGAVKSLAEGASKYDQHPSIKLQLSEQCLVWILPNSRFKNGHLINNCEHEGLQVKEWYMSPPAKEPAPSTPTSTTAILSPLEDPSTGHSSISSQTSVTTVAPSLLTPYRQLQEKTFTQFLTEHESQPEVSNPHMKETVRTDQTLDVRNPIETNTRVKPTKGRHKKRKAAAAAQAKANRIQESEPQATPIPDEKPAPIPDEKPAPTTPPKPAFTPGFFSQDGTSYTPLADVTDGIRFSTVGIIVSSSPPKMTKKGDYCISVDLIDSSLPLSQPPFKCNLFRPKDRPEWLPKAEVGNILLIRTLKANIFNGRVVGVGFNDSIRVLEFSPKAGSFLYGTSICWKYEGENWDLGDEMAGVATEYFNPFVKPGPAELDYFLRLDQWYQDLKASEPQQNQPIYVPPATSRPRLHMLIQDVKPRDFFDCTVEILANYPNSMVSDIYVTDYTSNPSLAEQSTSHSGPPGRMVLKISLWDVQNTFVEELQVGQFFHLRNVRMKVNGYGYWEAAMGSKDNKRMFDLLEKDSPIDEYLIELLKRKEEYWASAKIAAASQPNTDPIAAPTLESIHPVMTSPSCPKLLTPPSSDMSSSSIDTPDISFLSPETSQDPLSVASESIKVQSDFSLEILELEEIQPKLEPSSSPLSTATDLKSPVRCHYMNHKLSTISQVETSPKCPNKFRIQARVLDFQPHHPAEFLVSVCKRCRTKIKHDASCPKCSDAGGKQRSLSWKFWLLVEDIDQRPLKIQVAGEDAKVFLSDVNFHDEDWLTHLENRLALLLGIEGLPVYEEHLETSTQERVSVAPLLDLCIKSWQIQDEGDTWSRWYRLFGCSLI